jgi:hypothetical protein
LKSGAKASDVTMVKTEATADFAVADISIPRIGEQREQRCCLQIGARPFIWSLQHGEFPSLVVFRVSARCR